MKGTYNTIYSRYDLLVQAKKDVKYGFSFHPVTYAVLLIFSLAVDYMSIQPYEDLILSQSEAVAKALSLGIVFLIDIVVPVSLTKLLKTIIDPKRLNVILFFAIVISITVPMILLVAQKIDGADITMRERGTEVVISGKIMIITQIMFSIVPVSTTVAMTVMGLLRENTKIYRKYRYLELASSKIAAELDHVQKALDYDIGNIAKNDLMKLTTTVGELLAMRDTLFTNSRQILAASICDPAAAENIISSQPVYRISAETKQFIDLVLNDPVLKNEETDTEIVEEKSDEIAILKGDDHDEKKDA